MVETITSTTYNLKDNYFKVNVLKSKITGKSTFECFYLHQGREYHQFNHSANGLVKRFSLVLKKAASVETHALLQRVLYTFLNGLLVMEQHSLYPDQTHSVGNTQPNFHHDDKLENNLP